MLGMKVDILLAFGSFFYLSGDWDNPFVYRLSGFAQQKNAHSTMSMRQTIHSHR